MKNLEREKVQHDKKRIKLLQSLFKDLDFKSYLKVKQNFNIIKVVFMFLFHFKFNLILQ